MTNKQKSELLLPVGNMQMCLAAIHNGADAIYVGMPHFNARGRSADFSILELKEIIETCHLYGVKVNLAFNIVIFEEEINLAIELLKEVLPLAPDAIIVQDVGLARVIHQMCPEQIVHGSTQMTVTNHEAMSLLADLKIKRFVLGREVSLSEMRAIKEKTNCELEAFVHGALCVAYSGQCFTSESIGGRSANRGQCAQSCRFEYDLMVDGSQKEMGDIKYLVSPKDLCGIAEIPSLLSLGIESFKVEGRLKTPEYVASAARNYRQAIDQFHALNIESAKKEMSLTYSRGFYSGWLHGVNHQELVEGTFGAHRGLPIGTVVEVAPGALKVQTTYQELKKGDGVLVAGSIGGHKVESGGLLYDIKKGKGHEWLLIFGKDFNFNKIKKNFRVYLNHDSAVEKKLSKSFTDKDQKKRVPLHLIVRAQKGSPLEVEVTDGENVEVIYSEAVVEPSRERPLSAAAIENELGALGATVFKVGAFSFYGDKDIFLHQKELKHIRRQFSERLTLKRAQRQGPAVILDGAMALFEKKTKKAEDAPSYRFNILLREHEQVSELLNYASEIKNILGIVYLDFEFGKDYAPSIALLKKAGIKAGIATTRILKPNEYHNFKIIERACPDVILCRNLGALYYFKDANFELRADFSFNVTNSLSARYFLSKNVKSVCASYDLNARQLKDLLAQMSPGDIEVTIHQYMPSFHMEHCVFAAFLSKGTSFRDCGRPCEKHRVELRDQFGHTHQIKADQECRNTMFNSEAQSAGKLIPEFKKLGLTEFRFEALYEKGEELKQKIVSYAGLIENESVAFLDDIIEGLGVLEKYGLGENITEEKLHRSRKKLK